MILSEDKDEENKSNLLIMNGNNNNNSQSNLPSPPLSLKSSPEPTQPLQSIQNNNNNINSINNSQYEWKEVINNSNPEKGKGKESYLIREQNHERNSNSFNGNFSFSREPSKDFSDSSKLRYSNSPRLGDAEDPIVIDSSDDDESNDDIIASLIQPIQRQRSLITNGTDSSSNQLAQSLSSELESVKKKRVRSFSPISSNKSNNRIVNLSNQPRGSSATLPSPTSSPNLSPISKRILLPDLIPQPLYLSPRISLGPLKCRILPIPPPLESSKIPFYLATYVIPPAFNQPLRSIHPLNIDRTIHTNQPSIQSGQSSPARLGRSPSQLFVSSSKQNLSQLNNNHSPGPSDTSSTDDEEEGDDMNNELYFQSLSITSDNSPAPKLLETSTNFWRDLSPPLDDRNHLHPNDLIITRRRTTFHPSANPIRSKVRNLDPERTFVQPILTTNWKIDPLGKGVNALPDPYKVFSWYKTEEEEAFYNKKNFKFGFEALKQRHINDPDP